ncbi:MAG: hypothetical protein BroJett018_11170 [Chloroflexota bacterium]|nr:hypothetical protein [Chloroflexota bacterium]NOG64848.1 hypothetical protein [Chloroflexota bacterium]GIK63323.1 MAG: hypothetical protein BroJett018_11170 [Chloroflexota bacterium]
MEERLRILEMLREGQITPDEAEKLLQSLGDEPLTEADDDKVVILPKGESRGSTKDPSLPNTAEWWKVLFGVGIAVFGFFGFLLLTFFGFFAFLCLSPFVLIGGALAAVGLWSKSSHWLHVRVKDKDGTNINISLPLPVQFASWIMRVAQPYIKARSGDDVDLSQLDIAGMISAMGDELSPENPIMVAVEDNGDQVLVYIT